MPLQKMPRKECFIRDYENACNSGPLKYIVIAVKLPGGAKELIINTEDLENKFNYYMSMYDDDLILKDVIRIENWMFA